MPLKCVYTRSENLSDVTEEERVWLRDSLITKVIEPHLKDLGKDLGINLNQCVVKISVELWPEQHGEDTKVEMICLIIGSCENESVKSDTIALTRKYRELRICTKRGLFIFDGLDITDQKTATPIIESAVDHFVELTVRERVYEQV